MSYLLPFWIQVFWDNISAYFFGGINMKTSTSFRFISNVWLSLITFLLHQASICSNAYWPKGRFSLLFEGWKQSHFLYFLNAITSSLVTLHKGLVCVNRTELWETVSSFLLHLSKTALSFMRFFFFYSWSGAPVLQSFSSAAQSSTQQSPPPTPVQRSAYNRPLIHPIFF